MRRFRVVSLVLGLAVMFLASCLAPSAIAGSITVTDVGKSYGYTAADINSAITACQASADKTLYFSGGTYVDTGNITFPATITVQMGEGAVLQIASGITATFNGPFTAGLYQVFSGTGKAQFGVGAVKEVYPQWWGTGLGNDSAAIDSAIASSPASTGINVRLTGNFACASTIHVNRHRVTLIGSGMYATQLTFTPTSSGLPLFLFAYPGGSTELVQCSIRDLAIYGGNSLQKTAIKIVDNGFIEVRNIAIQNWIGTGSIGIQWQGREFGYFENISVVADLPISIEPNPYNSISIDHTVFNNTCSITLDKNGPAVKIASGVNLSNVVFQGTNSWNCGKYGLYWEDTTSAQSSENLSIKNVRMEQGTAPGGEIIHIKRNFVLWNLSLENIWGCSGGVGGIYLRKCTNVTLQNIFFASADVPATTALDIDESSSNIALINCFWWNHDSSAKTGNLIKTFGTNSNQNHSDNRVIEVYDAPNNPQGQGLILYGTNTWCYSGRLVNNGTYYLPVIGTGSHPKVATVTVSAAAANGTIASGNFAFGNNSAAGVLVAGTNNVAVTPTTGKLCLTPGNQVGLVNNLGVDVDVVVTVFWR